MAGVVVVSTTWSIFASLVSGGFSGACVGVACSVGLAVPVPSVVLRALGLDEECPWEGEWGTPWGGLPDLLVGLSEEFNWDGWWGFCRC